MVWYETDNDKGVDCKQTGARPANVGKVAQELEQWPDEVFSKGVKFWEKKLQNGSEPGTLIA